jgi:hypothetical protein
MGCRRKLTFRKGEHLCNHPDVSPNVVFYSSIYMFHKSINVRNGEMLAYFHGNRLPNPQIF